MQQVRCNRFDKIDNEMTCKSIIIKMNLNDAQTSALNRLYSIAKKAVVWTGLFYLYTIFRYYQQDYISKSVSDAVITTIIFGVMMFFVLMGLYVTLSLMFGNDNDMEGLCRFILDTHIAIMVAILSTRNNV
jgi:hypothetical protein